MGLDFATQPERKSVAPQVAREPKRHQPLNPERLESSGEGGQTPPPMPLNTRQSVGDPAITRTPNALELANQATIERRFQSLNDHNIKYVVVDGYHGLPFDLHAGDGPIIILFENPTVAIAGRPTTQAELHSVGGRDRQVVTLLNLQPSLSGKGQTYTIYEKAKGREVLLIPKGVGFWPDLFERQMLNSRVPYNKVIAIPDAACRCKALLHCRLHRTDWLRDEPHFKETLVEWIDSSVGNAQTCEIAGYELKWPSKQK